MPHPMIWLRLRRFVAFTCLGAAGMLAFEPVDPVFVPGHHTQQFLIGEDGDPGPRRAVPIPAPVFVARSVYANPPPSAPPSTPMEEAFRDRTRALESMVSSLKASPMPAPLPYTASLSLGQFRKSATRQAPRNRELTDEAVAAAPAPRSPPPQRPPPATVPGRDLALYEDVIAKLFPDPPALGALHPAPRTSFAP